MNKRIRKKKEKRAYARLLKKQMTKEYFDQWEADEALYWDQLCKDQLIFAVRSKWAIHSNR